MYVCCRFYLDFDAYFMVFGPFINYLRIFVVWCIMMAGVTAVHPLFKVSNVYSETSLIRTSDIQFPHLPQWFLLKQICNNPTVHYTTALSFIQFPHSIRNFTQNRCVWISEVWLVEAVCSWEGGGHGSKLGGHTYIRWKDEPMGLSHLGSQYSVYARNMNLSIMWWRNSRFGGRVHWLHSAFMCTYIGITDFHQSHHAHNIWMLGYICAFKVGVG